jgi:phosphoribosylanthranilate isomerase
MQFKVCGITSVDQANLLDVMGVHYVGFIFYPASKRYVLDKLTLDELAIFKPVHAKKVGVFVNEPLDQLLITVNKAGLDMVQLHGDEDVAYCAAVEKIIPVIKVFRVGGLLPNFVPFEQVVSYFLFDTDSKMYGGTGQHFNWELLKNNPIPKPYFLSGGIGPNDEQGIKIMSNTKAGNTLKVLDLNSQFEIEAGVKDLEKLKTFINVCI